MLLIQSCNRLYVACKQVNWYVKTIQILMVYLFLPHNSSDATGLATLMNVSYLHKQCIWWLYNRIWSCFPTVIIPSSQCCDFQPGSQSQLYDPGLFVQFPLFLQGELLHSLISKKSRVSIKEMWIIVLLNFQIEYVVRIKNGEDRNSGTYQNVWDFNILEWIILK